MKPSNLEASNRRILIVDDNPTIHDDLRKILVGNVEHRQKLSQDEELLFGLQSAPMTCFEVDSAFQGEEGLEKVKAAVAGGRPYALAFVDVRMPPGWDGVETIARIREIDPYLQTVICTAFSDYSWSEIERRLDHSDNLLILKKPFDNIEVIQIGHAMTRKWQVSRQAEAKMAELDRMVAQRTAELETANQHRQQEFEERAKAEEALRVIFQNSPVAIALMDEQGTYLDVNPAFEHQHGLEKALVIGKDAVETGMLDADTLKALLEQIATEGSVNEKEVIYTHPQDGRRTALFWVRSAKIASSTRYLGFILDITARKLTEQQLQRARVAAEAASKAKGAFLANMSHEIRTPINGILGFTRLTLASELNDEQRDYLQIVDGCTTSLLKVIEDILDFSKIEAGRVDLEQTQFSLRECVEGAAKALVAAAKLKNLDLECEVHTSETDWVIGDPFRLRQVMSNLIGNAVKFTSAGSVRVYLDSAPMSDRECEVHFRVEDTGIGIRKENLECVFESFRQAESSTTRKYGGTGLGLAISKQLVNLMGGGIWAESEEGRGSSFHFTVRLPRAGNAGASVSDENVVDSEPGHLSILIAEDNSESRKLVSTLIRQRGQHVTLANNGFEALIAYGRQHFDLILLDIQMPEMDGMEVVREIRKRERVHGGHIPIIALTAHAMKGDRERCLEAGMDGYLAKPLNEKELFATIRSLTAATPRVVEHGR